jgi:hypothetical protein
MLTYADVCYRYADVCRQVSEAFELMPRFDFIATQAAVAFYEGQVYEIRRAGI